MREEISAKDANREKAYELWMKAPNPMMTLIHTFDVTNLVRVSRRRRLGFHLLMDYCILHAAAEIREFYILPIGEKLFRYDRLAVSTIVNNRRGEISSCDLPYEEDLNRFAEAYRRCTSEVRDTCTDRDLSSECMVIGTSALVHTELDGVIGMVTGIYNNPFLYWGKYRRKLLRYSLPVSFQFHHTQMDGASAARFLDALQKEMDRLR